MVRIKQNPENTPSEWLEFFIYCSEYRENRTSCIFGDSNVCLLEIFKKYPLRDKLRISEYLNVDKNVSLHSVIANKNDIYISPFQQRQLCRYGGSLYCHGLVGFQPVRVGAGLAQVLDELRYHEGFGNADDPGGWQKDVLAGDAERA